MSVLTDEIIKTNAFFTMFDNTGPAIRTISRRLLSDKLKTAKRESEHMMQISII